MAMRTSDFSWRNGPIRRLIYLSLHSTSRLRNRRPLARSARMVNVSYATTTADAGRCIARLDARQHGCDALRDGVAGRCAGDASLGRGKRRADVRYAAGCRRGWIILWLVCRSHGPYTRADGEHAALFAGDCGLRPDKYGRAVGLRARRTWTGYGRRMGRG